MFLIMERQKYLPSDFGIFSDLTITGVTERISIAVVLDTWAWIEYWRGNTKVRDIIEGPEHKITSMITIAELERFYGDDRHRMDLMVEKIRPQEQAGHG